MRIQEKMKIALLVLAVFLLLPAAAQASVSIACTCVDNDGDGFGNPASEKCRFPELDCDDNCCDDPPVCASCTCDMPECSVCAQCVNLNATEVCDGVDNDCDGMIDEEPEASASCDDGVICTVDVCNADTHTCENTPDDSLCDDELWCNGAETCDAVDGCQPGADACPDDGEFCNGSESCDEENDQCVSSGDPCSDGNDCTDDVCNEVEDICEHPCNATGFEDDCCEDPACAEDPICKVPECGDGVADPGEECGEPGLAECPAESPFCVDCKCSPIAIQLSYFYAKPGDGVVLITWGTGSEIQTAGFNLLRSEEELGQYSQINAQLIPNEGGPSQGADYSYTDSDVEVGETYWYKLEEVEVGGGSNLHGPVSTTVGAAAGGCAASSAEAAAIGTSTSNPFRSLYPVGLPLLLIGVWTGVRVCRRGR